MLWYLLVDIFALLFTSAKATQGSQGFWFIQETSGEMELYLDWSQTLYNGLDNVNCILAFLSKFRALTLSSQCCCGYSRPARLTLVRLDLWLTIGNVNFKGGEDKGSSREKKQKRKQEGRYGRGKELWKSQDWSRMIKYLHSVLTLWCWWSSVCLLDLCLPIQASQGDSRLRPFTLFCFFVCLFLI